MSTVQPFNCVEISRVRAEAFDAIQKSPEARRCSPKLRAQLQQVVERSQGSRVDRQAEDPWHFSYSQVVEI